MSISPPSKARSEEHTSELQSLAYLVCRLLLEKKKAVSPPHAGLQGIMGHEPCVPHACPMRAPGDVANHARHAPRLSFHALRLLFVLLIRRHPRSTLFPYTTLFRSRSHRRASRCESRVPSPTSVCRPACLSRRHRR